jgi:hypothetical protein
MHNEIRSGRPLWMILMTKFCYFREISVWNSSIDVRETVCWSFGSVAAFTWISLVQIVPFALGSAPVDRWSTAKTKGVCKCYVAIIACCRTERLASSCDWWWFLVFFDRLPCRMWTLSRDNVVTKSRLDIQSKSLCLRLYGIPAASIWLTDSQMISKWTAPISWQICLSYRTNDLFSRKGAAWETTCDSCRQLLCSHKSGFNILAWRTQCSPHATPTVFT